MNGSSYVPLWVKSNFSFLIGASHPYEYMERAAELGLSAVALTDRDSVAGVVQAYSTLQETAPAAIQTPRLIIGAEITLETDIRAVVLAQNRNGYGNITSLISRGQLASPKGESKTTMNDLSSFAQDVILLWVAPYAEHISCGDELLWSVPADVLDAYGDRLYFGLARHGRRNERTVEALVHSEAQRSGRNIVAVPEILYHAPARRRLQDVLTCIRLGTTIEAAGACLRPNATFALSSPDIISYLYHDMPEAILRTREVAERCSFALTEIEYRYPRLPDAKGKSDGERLRERAERGALRRYGEEIPQDVREQIEKELALIAELRYDGYFLTMWEIIRFCRENGILCQGRGSAANSVVCYALGITAIDPVRMDLLFERFISRERAEPPDIDLDIEHNRREEVIRYVYERYGREYAAMVCNVVRYRRRSAVREVGKVFGIPLSTIERIAKLLSHRGTDIAEAARVAGLPASAASTTFFVALTEEIREFPRHLSIHPGGFLLSRDPIHRIVPIENATMPGRTVVQWDKYAIEDMHLFKVDLLGLGALTHLDYAFRLLHRHRGRDLSMASIPVDCRRTFEMIQRGDTLGVFQIESRAQMAMLPRLRPERFYDLVIEISIVRPGPIAGGMVHPYLRRRNGEEEILYPHPSLEAVLAKTLGVPLFQEQVMKLAVVAADYSPGEADQLRRDMAAWRRSGRIEKHRDQMVARMVAKGIESAFAEQVFEQIRGFGEYGFPESHAASFALIAYSTAWLRRNFPVEFTCALLNAWPMGFYSPATIVNDARRRGLEIRPIDVLLSDWECTMEREGSCREGYAIRLGLRFVRSFGLGEWERLRAARESVTVPVSGSQDDRFAALTGFVEQMKISKDVLLLLGRAGAFQSFGIQRRNMVWRALGLHGRCRHPADPLLELFPVEEERDPDFSPLTSFERVTWDYLTTGQSTLAHPLEPYRAYLRKEHYPTAGEVRALEDGSFTQYVGMVICRQRPDTASGTVFLTLEDETGFVNLIVWPDRFAQFRTVLLTGSFLAVSGRLQIEATVMHMIVENAWHPELPGKPHGAASRDFH